MQYLLLIYSDEKELMAQTQEETGSILGAYGAYMKAMADAGVTKGADGWSDFERRPPCASRAARHRCSTAPMPRPGSSSAATSSSTPPISTRRSPGRRVVLARNTARSRCVPSGKWSQVEPTDWLMKARSPGPRRKAGDDEPERERRAELRIYSASHGEMKQDRPLCIERGEGAARFQGAERWTTCC